MERKTKKVLTIDKIDASNLFAELPAESFMTTSPHNRTHVIIGKDCVIHPTATFGGDGFGLKRDKKTGRPIDVPQEYNVLIGNDVRIGEHTNIDRGSWRNTVVHSHCRIDALVHIGHNTIIGESTFITAGSIIGGSVDIGEKVYIGMSVTINQRIKIGDQAIIGSGAMVIRDVPARDIVAGNPAKSIKHKSKLSEEQRFSMTGY